jgi:pimeloyl-ACP methyl ester carboxylesterase
MRRLSSCAGRGPSVLFARLSASLLAAVLLARLFAPRPALAGNGVAAEAPAPAGDRLELLVPGATPVYGAAPARPDRARATFVYLHGVCGMTIHGCGHFAGAPGWLACPQANRRCANGGSAWGGTTDEKLRVIDDALAATRERWPESAAAPVVLVGFSQGSYVAMDAARARPGRFAGLLLLGADTRNADRFVQARVPRIALACGAGDMMFRTMQATPRILAPHGVAAQFASLGAVGHTYAAADGTDSVLTSLLAWVSEDAPPPLEPCTVVGC